MVCISILGCSLAKQLSGCTSSWTKCRRIWAHMFCKCVRDWIWCEARRRVRRFRRSVFVAWLDWQMRGIFAHQVRLTCEVSRWEEHVVAWPRGNWAYGGVRVRRSCVEQRRPGSASLYGSVVTLIVSIWRAKATAAKEIARPYFFCWWI